ncbi:MAG TPA: hypothetical protein VGG48_19305 [Rhizomicrobium sp.]|jgi:hypothetical protein
MKIHQLTVLALAGIALSGCATIINGTTQSVSISTPPVAGAQCTLTSSEGTWYVTTPGSVTVHKTKNDLNATCKKDGYQDATTVIPSKFNATTVGNVLLGGVIGIGVDAASGANYSYPDATEIPMVAVSGMTPPATPPATGATPVAPPAPPAKS